MLENYCKTVLIEANTMIDMAKTEIAPAVSAYVFCAGNAVRRAKHTKFKFISGKRKRRRTVAVCGIPVKFRKILKTYCMK